jgi:hypothetical protein
MTHSIDTRISHEDRFNFLVGFLLLLCGCILIAVKIVVCDNSKSAESSQESVQQVVTTFMGSANGSLSSSIQVTSYNVEED